MKQTVKTLLSLLLLAAFAAGLTGCGGTTSDTPADSKAGAATEAVATTAEVTPETESIYDDNGYLKDSLPSNLNFKSEFTLLYWSDRVHEEFEAET